MKKNKTYAIVGENGCGKSTLIKLLLGLYKNYDGEILFCDDEIKNMSQDKISQNISVVFQDYAKYYLTLKENILVGNLNANDSKITEAINLFSLDKVAENINENAILNKGDHYNADLSGGQWQNIALARNHISEATVTILMNLLLV